MTERLERYVELACEICREADSLIARAEDYFTRRGVEQTFRDRVLSGIALKIDGALRALIDDARQARTESMHHLKTMVEAFIHFRYVLDDRSDVRAALVLATAFERKAQFQEGAHGAAASADAAEWRRLAKEFRAGNAADLPGLSQMAEACRLTPWYNEVYRLACEPAHLGDLIEFTPDADTARPARPYSVAQHRAVTALHYGCAVALFTLRAIAEHNEAGLSAPVDALDERLRIVSGVRRSSPAWHCNECGEDLCAENVDNANVKVAEHIGAHNAMHALEELVPEPPQGPRATPDDDFSGVPQRDPARSAPPSGGLTS